jgi:hypothetical protein
MGCREEFEKAHVEQLGFWPAGIQYSGDRYYPASAGDLPYPAEEVNKRYLLFKSGRRSLELVIREAIKRLNPDPANIAGDPVTAALLEMLAVGGMLKRAIEEEKK